MDRKTVWVKGDMTMCQTLRQMLVIHIPVLKTLQSRRGELTGQLNDNEYRKPKRAMILMKLIRRGV